jgi:hypothetical protein
MPARAATPAWHDVLEWERTLLSCRTLEQLIGALDCYPGDGASPVATLVIADPTHELRHLLLGSLAQPLRGVAFVDSLVGLAPPLPRCSSHGSDVTAHPTTVCCSRRTAISRTSRSIRCCCAAR